MSPQSVPCQSGVVDPINSFYVDESGNTGDAIRAGRDFGFGAQPLFALACVGTNDETALTEALDDLKARHRIRSLEPKAPALRDKPAFVYDLVRHLSERWLPVFVEIVDKKYFICLHIVNTLFLPGFCAKDFAPDVQFLRNVVADYLHARLPHSCLLSAIEACKTPSRTGVGMMFDTLAHWLASEPPSDIKTAAKRMLDERHASFDVLKIEEAVDDFLPVPDAGKHGQHYWMLPNLSSFTNIYARINLYRAGDLSDVTIVHDEQAQFDDILRDNKGIAEDSGSLELAKMLPNADYHFTQSANLRFATSQTSSGIMAADCIAGFVNRHVMQLLKGITPGLGLQQAFEILLATNQPALGINFVLPKYRLRTIGVA